MDQLKKKEKKLVTFLILFGINKKEKRKSMSDETLSNFLLFAKQTVKTLKAKQLALESISLVMGYVFGINKEGREL